MFKKKSLSNYRLYARVFNNRKKRGNPLFIMWTKKTTLEVLRLTLKYSLNCLYLFKFF